ncbi:pyridoxal phosphate-dependent transferase [Jimgerdemannia flammicorona]|uniref:Pyridoxal phosphate-dependent transferase n=1 Tax=Jimgerdemannia flammicorona TaxID=994334 RepID=A0A433R026_9FUNG|nr:pyridoxal phosphate-dependent transferase [Jimgerdemannia flammicorona]
MCIRHTQFLRYVLHLQSPALQLPSSGNLQSDFYRPLRLPTILVGDSNLGGISTTLTARESLHIRGYDIPAILLFDNPRFSNHELIARHFRSLSPSTDTEIEVTVIPPPPAQDIEPERDAERMRAYYKEVDEYLVPVMERLNKKHEERFDRLEGMEANAKAIVWWPFTQHKKVKEVTIIDSAYGDVMVTYGPTPADQTATAADSAPKPSPALPLSTVSSSIVSYEHFDACASWWTQGLGHGNPQITLSAAHASGRYGHVIFPECAHEPAISLASLLLSTIGRPWASRVFYSDNGSTATEVALKMAFRSAAQRYGWEGDAARRVDVIGIDGGYHGDTIGAMDACSANVFNRQVQWYEPKGAWFEPPIVQVKKGRVCVSLPGEMTSEKSASIEYDAVADLFTPRRYQSDPLRKKYVQHIRTRLEKEVRAGRRFGALLMEPVLMGAGGMVFVDPLFQRSVVEVVRESGGALESGMGLLQRKEGTWSGLPVVFDEVFTGLWRLGKRNGAELLDVTPDIATYAKLLTGGVLPLAVTLTNPSIFDTFISSSKSDALLHGHSYTAHPMGCSAANTAVQEMERMNRRGDWEAAKLDWGVKTEGENGDWEGPWCVWDKKTVDYISYLPNVEGVVPIGSVLAIELKDDTGSGYASTAPQYIVSRLRRDTFGATDLNVFARPLGNVVYLMTSQVTAPRQVREIERLLVECLEAGRNSWTGLDEGSGVVYC